jgi:membrane peptidoglycan carboxypeptidase
MADSEHIDPQVLADRDHPRRAALLERFADEEGRVYLSRFYRRYQGLSPATAERQLLDGVRKAPVPLANAFYGLEPDGDAAGLALFLQRHLPGAAAQAEALHAGHGPGRWSLADQAYLAGVHPLELWLAGHLRRHPDASLAEVIAASAAQRQQAYAWLFKTRHKGAQDRRIRELQETLAFEEIARAWQRLGYPFQALTPSYASALGASGDRPSALAELMGIVVNRGLRLPTTPLQSLTFAAGTPYETRLQQTPAAPQRVLDAEVAEMARRALIGVVEDGTGRRLKGALVRRDGSVVAIGGKTGTGDHRYDVYGRGGRLVSSRVDNRSATLVFLLGERHFGTLMVYVHEPHAARYRFTSALPTQLLKALTPTLLQLVDGPTCTPGTAAPRPAGP